jgi:deoxyribonuclease V
MLDLEKLKAIQTELAKKVVINNNIKKVETIAGYDIVGVNENEHCCSVVVLEFPSLKLIDKVSRIEKIQLPYAPGYQAFREGPILVNTFAELKEKPDILMIKGHGISHKRRIGVASQIGLQLNIPTIGIAQKKIDGEIKGDKLFFKDEVRAVLIKTHNHANPIIVSPGHLISLNKSVDITKQCIVSPHKLPEPLFIAHKIGNKKKKS